jgi:protease I
VSLNKQERYFAEDQPEGIMRNNTLKGKRIAILATEGFEQAELEKPKQALENAGATADVITPAQGIKDGKIKGWDTKDWGDSVQVDVKLADAEPDDYDMLVLPGGVMNPDKLRANPDAVNFVKEIAARGLPIAAICHGPWTLIEADLVRGRTMTSWPSLQTDLRNAGANWVDEEVVEDAGLITSRNPNDLPAFNRKIVEILEAGAVQYRKAS